MVGGRVELERGAQVEDVYGEQVELEESAEAARIFGVHVRLRDGASADAVTYTQTLEVAPGASVRTPPQKVGTLPTFPLG